VAGVVFGNYRDLFTVIASSAATLTGLLFVATSVSNSRSRAHPPVIREFRAAASLLAFTNAFTVSLFGLVPGTNIGYPAAVLGVIGLTFTAAGVRATLTLSALREKRRPQLSLIVILLVAFGAELVFGIELIARPHHLGPVGDVGDVLIASLLIGIARAWELVGEWDTGIASSIAVLIGHTSVGQRPPPAAGAEGDDRPGTDPVD
jgi:hypothetical protein